MQILALLLAGEICCKNLSGLLEVQIHVSLASLSSAAREQLDVSHCLLTQHQTWLLKGEWVVVYSTSNLQTNVKKQ